MLSDRCRNRNFVRQCKACKKKFNPFQPYDAKRGKFCSRRCWKSCQKQKLVIFNCLECGRKCKRNIVFYRRYKRKFCSKVCFRKNNRTEANPLRRQANEFKYHHGAKEWKQRTKAWLKQEPYCIPCNKKAQSTDHIVPFSAICKFSPGSDPDIDINLMALCQFCHGLKTAADRHLFRGDLMRFRQMLAPTWPMDRVEVALQYYGFTRKSACIAN